jgi:hypothetical protein
LEDLDGMLDWVEFDGEAADAPLLAAVDRVLGKLGCATRVALEGGAKALLGGTTDLAGVVAAAPSAPFVRFVRGATPAARPYFASTPVVSPSVWQPLQSKRVRYFPKPPKPSPSASGSAATPTAAPSASSLPIP